MRLPKVSILIPVYNTAELLPDCLDSVLGQTYSDLEICIVNDGSTDNSDEVCNRYVESDSRIHYVSKQNEGVSATRNRLLDMASGDAVLFVDSDDWIESDMVATMVTLGQEYQAQMVCCQNVSEQVKVDAGQQQSQRQMPPVIVKKFDRDAVVSQFLFHKELTGSLCNKLIDINLLHRLRFPEGIGYGEDAAFVWQVLQRVDTVVVTSQQLYHYRMNPTSISHTTYGTAKLTADHVWQTICEDTERLYPEKTYIARGRHAMEMTQLLLAGARDNVPSNPSIRHLQQVVRHNFSSMKRARITSWRGLLFAWFASRFYDATRRILKS